MRYLLMIRNFTYPGHIPTWDPSHFFQDSFLVQLILHYLWMKLLLQVETVGCFVTCGSGSRAEGLGYISSIGF